MATSLGYPRRWSQTSSGIQEARAGGLQSFDNIRGTNTASAVTTGRGGYNAKLSSESPQNNKGSRYLWQNVNGYNRDSNVSRENQGLGYLVHSTPPWSVDSTQAIASQSRSDGLLSNKLTKNDLIVSTANFRPDAFQSAPYSTTRDSTTGFYQFDNNLKEPIINVSPDRRSWSRSVLISEYPSSGDDYPREFEMANDIAPSAGLQAVNNISKLASRIKAVGEILDRYDKVGLQRKNEMGYGTEAANFHKIPEYIFDNNTYDGYERQSLKSERNNVWTNKFDQKTTPQSATATETLHNMRTRATITKDDSKKSNSVFDLRAIPEKEFSDAVPYFSINEPKKSLSIDTDYDARKHGMSTSSDDLRTFRSLNCETNNVKPCDESFPTFNPIKDYKRSWISENNLVAPTELDCLQDRIEAISTKFNYVPKAYRYILRNNGAVPQDDALPDGEYVQESLDDKNNQLKSVTAWYPRKLRAQLKPQFEAPLLSDEKDAKVSVGHSKRVSWGDDKRVTKFNTRLNNLETNLNESSPKADTESLLVRRPITTNHSTTHSPSGSISANYSTPHPPSGSISANYSTMRQPQIVNGPINPSRSSYSTPSGGTRDVSRQLAPNVGETYEVTEQSTHNSFISSPGRSIGIHGPINSTMTSVQSAQSSSEAQIIFNSQKPVFAHASSNLNKSNTYVSRIRLPADGSASAAGEYAQNELEAKFNRDVNVLTKSQSDLREVGDKSVCGSDYHPRYAADTREIINSYSNGEKEYLLSPVNKQTNNYASKLGYNSSDGKFNLPALGHPSTSVNTLAKVQSVTQKATSNDLENKHLQLNNFLQNSVEVSKSSILAPTFSKQNPLLQHSMNSFATAPLDQNPFLKYSINSFTTAPLNQTRSTLSGAYMASSSPTLTLYSTNYVSRPVAAVDPLISFSSDKTRVDIQEESISRPIETFSTPYNPIVRTYNGIQTVDVSKSLNSVCVPTSAASINSNSQMSNSPSITWPGEFNANVLNANSTLRNTSASTGLTNTPSTWINQRITLTTSAQPYDNYRKNNLSAFGSMNTPPGPTWNSALSTSASTLPILTFLHSSSTISSSTISSSTFSSSTSTSSSNLTAAFCSSPPTTFSRIYTPSAQTFVTITSSSVPALNDIYKEKMLTCSTVTPATGLSTFNGSYSLSWNTPVSTTATTTTLPTSYLYTSVSATTTTTTMNLTPVSPTTLFSTSASSFPNKLTSVYSPSSTAALTTTTTGVGYNPPTFDSLSINQNLLSSIEALRKLSNSLSNRRTQEPITKTENTSHMNYSGSSGKDDKLSNSSSYNSSLFYETPSSNIYSSCQSYLLPVSRQTHQYSVAQSRPIVSTTSSGIDLSNAVVGSFSSPPCAAKPQSSKSFDVSSSISAARYLNSSVCTQSASFPTVSSNRNNNFDPVGDGSTVLGSVVNLSQVHAYEKSTVSHSYSTTDSSTSSGLNTTLCAPLSANNSLHDASTRNGSFWHKNSSTPDLTLSSLERTANYMSGISAGSFPTTKSSSVFSTSDWLPKYQYTSALNEYDSYDSSYFGADVVHLTLPPVTYNRHRSVSSTDSEDRCLSVGDSTALLADDWTTAMDFNLMNPSRKGSRDCLDDIISRSSDTEFVVMRSGEIVKRRCGGNNGNDVIQTI